LTYRYLYANVSLIVYILEVVMAATKLNLGTLMGTGGKQVKFYSNSVTGTADANGTLDTGGSNVILTSVTVKSQVDGDELKHKVSNSAGVITYSLYSITSSFEVVFDAIYY
jgi:hypothetical protein